MILYLFIFTVYVYIYILYSFVFEVHACESLDIMGSHPQGYLKQPSTGYAKDGPFGILHFWTQPHGCQIQVCPKSKAKW